MSIETIGWGSRLRWPSNLPLSSEVAACRPKLYTYFVPDPDSQHNLLEKESGASAYAHIAHAHQ
jgi:hypothetical protein